MKGNAMLYSGDEDYGDDVTSPLYRPMRSFIPSTRSPRRLHVRKARRAIAPSVYEEYADLYIPSNDAEDRYNRGGLVARCEPGDARW